MNKNHSPGGVRIVMRVLFYTSIFVAIIGMRETLTEGHGPVSNKLGRVLNQVLMTSSQVGLGVAMMNSDKRGEHTLVGHYSRALGKASHEAFVSAAKVDIFARH